MKPRITMGAKRRNNMIISHIRVGNKFYGRVIRIKGLRKDEVIDRNGKVRRVNKNLFKELGIRKV